MKQIEKLIEKFMNAETTLQEEQTLYTYFKKKDIPEELEEYREFFLTLGEVAPAIPKAKTVWLRKPLRWVAAASILLVLGGASLWGLQKDQKEEPVCYLKINGKVITDKEVVLKHMEEKMALLMLSEERPQLEFVGKTIEQ